MTATAVEEAPSEWPEGALYYSPRGLYPFQANHIAGAYLGIRSGAPGWMFTWDMGLGKSHAAMRLSTLGFEDGVVDFVLLVCEKSKLKEWRQDFEDFTRLKATLHYGPARKNRLVRDGMPQVMITTYETGRADLVEAQKTGRKGRTLSHGDLLNRILDHARHPMVIFDESDKLSNRSSQLYKAYDYTLRALRKVFKNPVVMLTGTPIRTNYEDAFNQLRLLRPGQMPLVKEFDGYFVRARDHYGRALYHDFRMGEFTALCEPMILSKSKTDPDVIEQFPQTTEKALWVDLDPEQRKIYKIVESLDGVAGQLTVLRQICAHPASLIHSATHGQSKLAKALVEELGEDYLRSVPSAKTEMLVSYVEPIVKGQNDKVLVFSFFGPSVLPHLRAALTARGIPVLTYGEDGAVEEFKSTPQGCVLLASDAAARGINLPEATYLVEYDLASAYGVRSQRINRASRIGQGGASLTVRSMLARESVEVGLLYAMLRGHGQSDELLGRGVTGEQYLTAAMRREILTRGM